MPTANARRGVARFREPRRAIRIAQALWTGWALIVWNVVFDHVIVVAGRSYLGAAAAAARIPGHHVRMDNWMRPAVTEGLWIATASALAILLVGFALIGLSAARPAARAPEST
jgi:hypothetical protein